MTTPINGGVIVAHPGTQHAYQTALGLQQAGMLKAFVTGLYYKPDAVWASGLGLLPSTAAGALERQLRRRHLAGLNPNRVRQVPLGEIVYLLSAKSRALRARSRTLIRWRNERFDRVVANLVERERPGVFVGYDSSSLRTFEACRRVGTVAVLDQSIGHLRTGVRILQEEAALHPEFADGLALDVPAWQIERCAQEAQQADRILAASTYVRDSLVAEGVAPERILHLPYGVDVERFHPAPREDDRFRILFVGGIGQRKGIKYLLEAFKRLGLPHAELVLVGGMVGDGRGLAPYEGLFRHVPGVPHHAVHTLYQQADVFVLPSLHEGSAIVTYEAMASGLPVIVTPHAGAPVTDGEEGFIVPIRDIDALMDRLKRLHADPELRALMGQRARDRAMDLTWAKYQTRLTELIGSLSKESLPC